MREHATSDEVMRLVFERVDVPLCLLAPNLTVLRVSAEWLRWMGSTEEALVGHDVREVLPDASWVVPSVWECVQRRETVDLPLHVERVNGRELWWEGQIAPLSMEGGTGALVIVRAATSQQGASAKDHPRAGADGGRACSEVEESIESVATAVPGVLYTCHVGRDGVACCPFSTPAAEEIFGVGREQLAESIEPLSSRVPADDLQEIRQSIAESTRALSPWHSVFRYEHPAKGQRWIEAWSVPRRYPAATVWYGYAADVTERMQAHEALRRSEEHYRSFFTNLLELVGIHEVVRGPSGEVVDWVVRDVNEPVRALMGIGPEEVIGRRFSELFPSDVRHALTARWPDVLATRRPVQYEFELRGRVLWISVAAMDESTVSAVADDMTSRKRAEDALREADRRKGEFLAVLSHELRNPLAPIRNAIYLLERAAPASEQATRAQAVIRRQTDHLARLVDDLLDVTRIARGKVELHWARIDLREVVQRTCDDLHTLFTARNLTLRTELPERPVWIDADNTRIAQVVGNLLHNAAKFSHEGGRVDLALTAEQRDAELRVRDEGVGIPPELQARLFEPFVQADRSLARTPGGLGLGLALVKQLVELHGGVVAVQSEGIDRGTEVRVRLPLTVAPQRQAPSPSPSLHSAVILVIEDNVDAASTLATVLEGKGHHVSIATDGRSGLARARELRPEVVLCDIGLPDVDGYEIARQLRLDAALRNTRLVAVSGYALPEDRRRALEAGFDAHVAKPAPLDVLLATLGAA